MVTKALEYLSAIQYFVPEYGCHCPTLPIPKQIPVSAVATSLDRKWILLELAHVPPDSLAETLSCEWMVTLPLSRG
jgi:hypothetical protein